MAKPRITAPVETPVPPIEETPAPAVEVAPEVTPEPEPAVEPTPEPVATEPAPAPEIEASIPAPAELGPIDEPGSTTPPVDVAGPFSGLAPAGYLIGWVEHEVDSVPDHNGVRHKIRVHSLGLVPVK